MAIIALSGYAKSGKNTVATIIQYLLTHSPIDNLESVVKNYDVNGWWLEGESGWQQKGFADKLKQVAYILTGVPAENFSDQDFKLTNLPPQWSNHGMPMTVREFLQKLGTDALRDGLHPNTWVNALMADYKDAHQGENGLIQEQYGKYNVSIVPNPVLWSEYYPKWIITDCRFINEANAVKKENGIIIRVNRPGIAPVNNHPSETAIDGYKFDYVIENISDLKSLAKSVEIILLKQKLL
jgi:hypothetical protein